MITIGKFKPIKLGSIKTADIPKIKEDELVKYKDYLSGITQVHGISLEDTEKMEGGSIIPELTIFTLRISRIIQGKYGNYQICNFKDLKGNSGILNIYNNRLLGEIEEGKVYTFKNIYKTSIDKGYEKFTKLALKKYGAASEGDKDESKQFDQVKLGEIEVSGTVIGITDAKMTCPEDNQAIEDGACKTCKKSKIKLTATIYIQTDEDVEQIKVSGWNLKTSFKSGMDPEVWFSQQLESKKIKVQADKTYNDDLQVYKLIFTEKLKIKVKTEEKKNS